MTINSAAILKLIELEQTCFSLVLENGNPCKEIGIEELRMLASAGHVCARWRGNRIRSVQLIVSAEVAFRGLGETCKLIRDALHSDASQMTQRASENLPGHVRRHHPARCSSFGGMRSLVYGRVDSKSV